MPVCIWTVPAAHMKSKKGATEDFRIPLSDEAFAVVQEALRHGGDVLFPGLRCKPISDTTMSKYMRDRDMTARPHRFRSSLRIWAEETGQPFEVAETALGHVFGNQVERAYQRSDLIEKRKPFLTSWADHVSGKPGADVVRIEAACAAGVELIDLRTAIAAREKGWTWESRINPPSAKSGSRATARAKSA